MKRNRKIQIILIAVTLVVGMASRKFPQYFHPFLAEYLGDTFWALLVFLLFGFVFIRRKALTIATYALAFSYLIEISQLYHASWIDAIRDTTFGALVLGHGFLWSDLICYTVGVAIGVVVDMLIFAKRRK